MPTRGVYTKDIVIDSQMGVRVRLFVPVEGAEEPLPVVFYFHGGGFATLSSDFLHAIGQETQSLSRFRGLQAIPRAPISHSIRRLFRGHQMAQLGQR